MAKEIILDIPEGYKLDKEHSTLKCLKLIPIKSQFGDYNGSFTNEGYIINTDSKIVKYTGPNLLTTKNRFATEKHAKSALAMAQISQIMANDKRFGGVITDKEYKDINTCKYIITRFGNEIQFHRVHSEYHFLAFHTEEQRDLFFQENEKLVWDYLMVE